MLRHYFQVFDKRALACFVASMILVIPSVASAQSRQQIANDWFVKGVSENTCAMLRGGSDYQTAFGQAWKKVYSFIPQSESLERDQKQYLLSTHQYPSASMSSWIGGTVQSICSDAVKTTTTNFDNRK